MTSVKIKKDRLIVTGHTYYADKGKDIVCAAVSILIESLGQSLLDMGADGVRIKLSAGEAKIRFSPTVKTDGAMAVVSAGFRMLAAAYPEYVEIVNEGDF